MGNAFEESQVSKPRPGAPGTRQNREDLTMTRLFDWLIAYRIHDPAWVQAYSSAALVVLSIITLTVLFLYAWDTHKLANASVEQVKNAQMPFLALVRLTKVDNEVELMMAQVGSLHSPTYLAWAVQNQGNSAAVNIRARGEFAEGTASGSSSFSEPLNPIPVGASVFIGVHPSAHVTTCTIDYSSLNGREFRTEITTVNGEHRLGFRRS